MKFGGTSVENSEAIQRVAEIVTSRKGHGRVVIVSALAKVSNFVPGAGLWLNTQRPEWNDANNALVGCGASVVTLCYLERLFAFLSELLSSVYFQAMKSLSA